MRFGKRKRRISRLLIVEDEPLIAFDTEYFLGESGFEVIATLDRVADAVRIITRDMATIDLVLADVNLADGSGIEVARTASALGVPVMFVTGNCPGEARTLAIGCLAKPYQQRDLLAAIEAIDAVLAGEAPRRVPAGFNLFAANV